ncbi:hypothetical protein RUM44_012775 [Polyplax serrata]|uniref:Uncharacterized protein n=1 Tax=Polyplax serrata TaxID=468196 RepID=A0ABR1BG08_POLSC
MVEVEKSVFSNGSSDRDVGALAKPSSLARGFCPTSERLGPLDTRIDRRMERKKRNGAATAILSPLSAYSKHVE